LSDLIFGGKVLDGCGYFLNSRCKRLIGCNFFDEESNFILGSELGGGFREDCELLRQSTSIL
jgi:hypothetical protein